MPLSVGTKLGPYEILGPIGVGGMGEVYRAKDTRLGREVALKVSAERFSERFEREARAIAAPLPATRNRNHALIAFDLHRRIQRRRSGCERTSVVAARLRLA